MLTKNTKFGKKFILHVAFNPSGGIYPLYHPVDGYIILAYMYET